LKCLGGGGGGGWLLLLYYCFLSKPCFLCAEHVCPLGASGGYCLRLRKFVVYEYLLSLLLCALIGFLRLSRSGIGPVLAPSVTSRSSFWVSLFPPRPISSSQCPFLFSISSWSLFVLLFSLSAHFRAFMLLFISFSLFASLFGTSALMVMEDLRPPVLYPAGRLWSHVSPTAFAYRHSTR
jgi:hypothetical protein